MSSTLVLFPCGSRTGEKILGFALLVALGEGAIFCAVNVEGRRAGEVPDPIRAVRPFEGDGATLGTVLADAPVGGTVTDARRAGLFPSLEPETLVAVADLTPNSVLPLTFFCRFHRQRLGVNQVT